MLALRGSLRYHTRIKSRNGSGWGMTALEKYARLAGPGVWRARAEAQRRDVVVELGEGSLIIKDARAGHALAHWSLTAIQRLNRGPGAAIFAPGIEADGETLELQEPLLIESLETISAALGPKPPAQWLRWSLIGGVAALAMLGALVLPGVLIERTAAIVPPAARAQIGRDALDGLTLSVAAVRQCAGPDGRQALTLLRNRVLGSDWRVVVVAGLPGFQSAHLPGQLVVMGDDLVSRLDSGEALAGWILAEAQAALAVDPLLDALDFAGVRATAGLLTTGALPEDTLDDYARRRFARAPAVPEPEALGRALEGLGISPTAYVLSLGDTQPQLTQALADRPGNAARSAGRILTDGEWLTVQAICAQ